MKFKKIIDKKMHFYDDFVVERVRMQGLLEFEGLQFLLDFGDFDGMRLGEDYKKVTKLLEILEKRLNE